MTDKWHMASFRVSSTERTLSQIEQILGRQADVGREIGTPIKTAKPTGLVREHSLWLLNSGLGDDVPLEEHIEALLSFIEAHLVEVRALSQDCEVEIYCGFGAENGQGSMALSPELLDRLAAAPVWFVLDLYPPSISNQ